MNATTRRMGWGLQEDVPATAIGAIGARAIQGRTVLDILHDRKDVWTKDDVARRAFVVAWQAAWNEIQNAALRLDPAKAARVVLFDRDGLTVVGNTNGSHGYVYILGYLSPLPASGGAK